MANEDDNKLWLHLLLLLATGLLIGWVIGNAKCNLSPQNAFREAIISGEYNMSSQDISSLKTQNYTINNTTLSSIASSIFVSSQTLASLEQDINKYDVMVENIIECESSGDHSKIGDTNYYVNGVKTPSEGIAQFQKRTFDYLKKLANKPTLDYTLEKDQRWLLKWALVYGYGDYWTCYRLLYEH